MSEKKQLNNDELEKVSGGDNGDVKSERSLTPEGVTPRYTLGQEVEVYISSVHVRTKRSRIEEIKIVYGDRGHGPRGSGSTDYTGYYWPLYRVYVIEDKEYREVPSDEIES